MKTINKILAFLTAIILLYPDNMFAQNEKAIVIEGTVTDEGGTPIPNAEVFGGYSYAKTDAEGKFTISVSAKEALIIEAKGYDTYTAPAADASNQTEFGLTKNVNYYYNDKDQVQLGFRSAYPGDIVGAYTKVNVSEIAKYDHSIWVSDVLAGRAQGVLGSSNIRGIGVGIDIAKFLKLGILSGNSMVVVDGLPRDIESLRTDEIESITVLKDVNAAVLYGSSAMNGVILITTKRGTAHKNSTKFSANYGISTPKDMPKYLNSADYMTYYNKNRVMDGLAETYSSEQINNYRNGNKYRYPDIDYRSDEYLKSMKNYFDLNGEFEGGNDIARYYANLGWYSQGGLIDVGDFSKARNNVFNVRANVDFKINSWINAAIDAVALFGENKTGRGNYWGAADTVRPFEFTPLLPISYIDPNNALLNSRRNDVNGEYLLGGNSSFTTNALANGYAGGIFERITRKFSFNNRIDFDLKAITEGLSFHTNFSFDFYNAFDQTVYNTYSTYEPTWGDGDKITALKQHGSDSRPGTQVVGNTTFQRRFGFIGQLAYDRTFNDVHRFMGNLIGFATQNKYQGTFQSEKYNHLGLQLNYTYDRRYIFDFSAAAPYSVRLPEGKRWGFSPTVGLGWVLSEEDFLKDNSFINYLKLKASAGMIKSDLQNTTYYLYDETYTTSTTFYWNEAAKSRSTRLPSRGSNLNLSYADRNEVNIGLQAGLADNKLWFDFNAFFEKYGNQIVRPSTLYPSFYSNYLPYENFEEDQYKGFDAGIRYNNKFGDFRFSLGLNVLYVTSKRTKVSEIYDYDYLYTEGHPVDATWGLEALGLFRDQSDIDNSPTQSYGTVRPGDIKYKDQNGDGVVDDQDKVYLRRWNAPLSGGFDLNLGYKNFSLYMLFEGRTGAKDFKESTYYWMDSNDKYSEIALDSWSTDNPNAKYPRITTQAGNNNLQRSSFWLYKTDYLLCRRIQLSYELPYETARHIFMKNMTVFVDASNPFRIAPERKILDMNTGAEPQYRTFSVGIKSVF